MNTCSIIGRLTRDPEVRYTASSESMAIARFTLAVDRRFKKDRQPSADFIPCVAFGKTAEILERYVSKGQQIAVVGHIQTGSFTNKEGQKIYTTDIIIDSFYFCGNKGDNANSATQKPDHDAAVDDGFMQINAAIEEELPFT